MKSLSCLLILICISSCSTPTSPKFVKEKVCSGQSLKYLRNPRNIYKQRLRDRSIITQVAATHKHMQLCYEDFRNRSGIEEFNTCLVVGVDDQGRLEHFNFDSQETPLDQEFINCASAVARGIGFEKFGKNYVLVQSYKFFVK